MSSDEVSLADKRPSISDVAEAAGVSKAAVSKVIRNAYGVSPAMRARVESAMRTGYRPRTAARAMRGSSYTIGLEIPALGNDFFMQLMEGAIAALDGSGYQLMLMPALSYPTGTSVVNALSIARSTASSRCPRRGRPPTGPINWSPRSRSS